MCPMVKKVNTANVLSDYRALFMLIDGYLKDQGSNDKRLSLFPFTYQAPLPRRNDKFKESHVILEHLEAFLHLLKTQNPQTTSPNPYINTVPTIQSKMGN